MDRLLPKSKRDFYIELHENKYYFPGDIIKGKQCHSVRYYVPIFSLSVGTVVLNLDKATRTNHIRITLTGIVKTDGNNKKNSAFHHHGHMATALNANQLQVLTLPPLFVAQEEKTLAAQSHRFPFEFQLPNTEPLPSSLKVSAFPFFSLRCTDFYVFTVVEREEQEEGKDADSLSGHSVA